MLTPGQCEEVKSKCASVLEKCADISRNVTNMENSMNALGSWTHYEGKPKAFYGSMQTLKDNTNKLMGKIQEQCGNISATMERLKNNTL